jgi:transmembrane sensor
MNEDTRLRLIAKKLSNSIDPVEEDDLRSWISETPENELLYRRLENYWNSGALKEKMAGQEQIFNRLSSMLDIRNENTVIATKHETRYTKTLWYVAASLLLIFTAGIAVWYMINVFESNTVVKEQITNQVISKSNPRGRKSLITLPDGSTVKLNAESYIEYEEGFIESRHIKLIGEAFFEVVGDPEREFLIDVGEMQVKVLGTSFNIQAYPFKKNMNVAVATGEVQISRVEGNKKSVFEILQKNEMISIDHQSGAYKVTGFDPDEWFAWRDGILVFNAQPYEEIFSRLERWYGVEIIVRRMPEISEGFTARYDNPSLEMVLEGISFTSDIRYRIEGKKIFID